MSAYDKIFMEKLKAEGVDYEYEDDVIILNLAGDNYRNYIVAVVVDDNDGMPLICISCVNIARFKGKENVALAVCNDLNSAGSSGLTRFVVEKDSEVSAYFMSFFSAKDFYEHGYKFLCSFCQVVDDAYPTLMKALYA